MDDFLLVIGAICIIAAIVGGGLTIFGNRIPVINSGARQLALFVFGMFLLYIRQENDDAKIIDNSFKGPFIYKVTIKTVDSPANAASNDVFYCKLIGANGKTEWLPIDTEGNDRQLGKLDLYPIKINEDIGKLSSIQFKGKKKTAGANEIDDWGISSIEVQDVNHGITHKKSEMIWVGDGSPPPDPTRAEPLVSFD